MGSAEAIVRDDAEITELLSSEYCPKNPPSGGMEARYVHITMGSCVEALSKRSRLDI